MERRKHPRVAYGAWVEDETEGGLNFFLARNISLGGILLRARETRPPIGHEVSLRLVIENERRVMSVHGKVVRHDHEAEQEFAVEFANLDSEGTTFIEDLVGELLKTQQSSTQ